MQPAIFRIITLIIGCCFQCLSWGQQELVITNIVIKDNHRTKDYIILQELDFGIGDTLSTEGIKARQESNEKRVLSTGLFTETEINISAQGAVHIRVREYWYIYPAPIFELADRNFNVWWNEQNRSLSRVNYGIRLRHINFSGQRDQLKVVAQFGYTRKFELVYDFPFINANRTIGLRGNLFYADQKEIGYITRANKTLFHKEEDERVLLSRFRMNATVNHRLNLYSFQSLDLSFHSNWIDDIVSQSLNPNYFIHADNRLQFVQLYYQYQLDKRDFTLFPRDGYLIRLGIKNEGLGIFSHYHNLSISAHYDSHYLFSDRWSIAHSMSAKTNVTRDVISFANNTGLGYQDDFLRGYELYVMDGTDYFYSKNELQFQLLDFAHEFSFVPVSQFAYVPGELYLSFHVDVGYVRERHYRAHNILNNRWLIGYGPSMTVMLYHNFLIRFDYSRNHLGEGALYIHQQFSF